MFWNIFPVAVFLEVAFCKNMTGTSQVSAISKAQMKSKGGRGPFTLIRFCRLRLKSKKPKRTIWKQKKSKKEVAQCRQKIERGETL